MGLNHAFAVGGRQISWVASLSLSARRVNFVRLSLEYAGPQLRLYGLVREVDLMRWRYYTPVIAGEGSLLFRVTGTLVGYVHNRRVGMRFLEFLHPPCKAAWCPFSILTASFSPVHDVLNEYRLIELCFNNK